MLQGDGFQLRLVREQDLTVIHAFQQDLTNRGDYFPTGVTPFPVLAARFQESGFWKREEGMLAIADDADEVIGLIEFFGTVDYLDELEISYILYSPEHRGRGITTQAVELLTGHLFDRTKVNRIRLVIHPDNAASRRVATKAGYTCEGVARGAWYHRGRNHDVEIWAVLRSDRQD